VIKCFDGPDAKEKAEEMHRAIIIAQAIREGHLIPRRRRKT
jgi:hypothetical protein